MKIEPHALLPAPGIPEIEGEMARSGLPAEQALAKLLNMRGKVIEAEERDPLRYGWEPTIWKVCDALIDWEWCDDQGFLRRLERRSLNWEGFKTAMRKRLGFEVPAKMILILGGQRSSKSNYAAKRGIQMLTHKERCSVAAMHMSAPRSVRDQQPLFHRYLPPEWKQQVASDTAYIKFKLKTGFSESSFITPNLATCSFVNYSQDMDTALQGREDDLLEPDELVPPDWIENIVFRLSTRAGRAILTFTPVHGYTPSVQMFCDGATPAIRLPAFLSPRDGGERDEAGALGLTPRELRELNEAAREKRAPLAPQSRSEDCLAWLDADWNPEAHTQGRTFEMLPKILRCVDPRKAVVFFWASDNPYGNPKEVAADLRKKSVGGLGGVRERFYGWADQQQSGKFPKFKRGVHVLPAAAIPKEGEDYMLVDPAKGRNMFMLWIRLTEGASYVLREWPGNYWVPGVGVPGPWAIPSGRKEGLNDGARGDGQKPFGFGLLRYKFEVARLERWAAWRTWRDGLGASHTQDTVAPLDLVEEWEESQDDGQRIWNRWLDSRAASEPRVENDRPVTLQTDFLRIGLDFDLTPGNDISDGIQRINSRLDYSLPERAEDTGFLDRPELFVCEECLNTIYALENWKNADGQHGACKEPIDLLRYWVDLGVEFGESRMERSRGGYVLGPERGIRRRWPGQKVLPTGGICRL